ncbi:hypothetical protein MMC16_004287 [Acarospora aff. strigata]|nr:hypothetical protein [Acarospora aff. strigata]
MVSTRSQSSNPAGSTTASTNAATRTSGNPRGVQTWAHTPSNLALIWLIISIPLVLWDTGYVVLRPHSMPGGALHSPIWTPYALYGSIDYIYGWPAYNSRNGFTAAQTSLNIVESLFYMYYLWIVYQHGRPSTSQGRGAPAPRTVGWLGQAKVVVGSMGGVACTVAFSAAVMTVSKTVLYWLNEYFSGFANIGHNDVFTLISLWIIPNGAWIVLPSYMVYVFGQEILEGLAMASGNPDPEGEDKTMKAE